MEDALAYAILFSPVVLIAALLRRWSKRRAFALLAVVAGTLTALFNGIDWGGSPEDRMTHGFVVLYGIAVTGMALVTAALMFIMNPPQPADEADRG